MKAILLPLAVVPASCFPFVQHPPAPGSLPLPCFQWHPGGNPSYQERNAPKLTHYRITFQTGSGKKHEGTGSTVSIEIFGDKSRGYFPSMGRNLSELGNLKSVRVRINGTGKGGKFLELVPNARLHYDDQFEDPNLPGTMITPVELREPSCFFSGGLGGAGGLLS